MMMVKNSSMSYSNVPLDETDVKPWFSSSSPTVIEKITCVNDEAMLEFRTQHFPVSRTCIVNWVVGVNGNKVMLRTRDGQDLSLTFQDNDVAKDFAAEFKTFLPNKPVANNKAHVMGPFTTILRMEKVGDEVYVQFQTKVLPFAQTYRIQSLQSVKDRKVVVWGKHEHVSGTVHSFPFYFDTAKQAEEFASELRARLPVGPFSPPDPAAPGIPSACGIPSSSGGLPRFDLVCPDPNNLD